MFKDIIEHRTKDRESAKALIKAIIEVRKVTARQPGFISSNVYADASDFRHVMIITTWETKQNWEAWDKSADRAATRKIVEQHLAEPFNAITLGPSVIFRDETSSSAVK